MEVNRTSLKQEAVADISVLGSLKKKGNFSDFSPVVTTE